MNSAVERSKEERVKTEGIMKELPIGKLDLFARIRL